MGWWLSGGRTRLEGRHVLGVEQRPLDSALRNSGEGVAAAPGDAGCGGHGADAAGRLGVALRAESAACYRRLFEGAESERPHYLMRPAPQVAQPAPAVEFLLFPATTNLLDHRDDEETAWTAWDRACRQGLGPHRHPFRISSVVPLAWDGLATRAGAEAAGFCVGKPPLAGRNRGNAVPARIPRPAQAAAPGQADRGTDSGRHRPGGPAPGLPLAGPDTDPLWAARRYWLELGRAVPCEPWQGRRLDLVRYSGSQKAEVELRGVAGSLALPVGPGPLSPLLAAAAWIHIGKGTVMGLGQIRITACDRDRAGSSSGNTIPNTTALIGAPDFPSEWAGSGLTSLKRQRRAFKNCLSFNAFRLRFRLVAVVGRKRAHKPEAQAKGVQKCLLFNALRLHFRLVASDFPGIVCILDGD